MKYLILKQLEPFLAKFRKITGIKRTGDMVIAICFDSKATLFFDLSKSTSSIYTNDEFIAIKEYKAPFDITLKKRFSNALISSVKVLENNRILKFDCILQGSYKSMQSSLYLEFTGRFTNAIITDENGVILDALRHIENSFRQIKPGKFLTPLEPIEMREAGVNEILDFDEFFKSEFRRLNEKNLSELKQIKINQISKKISSINASLELLESEEELARQSEELMSKATILLANLHNLNEFEREICISDFEGKEIKIKLEDSPKNSANAFFTRAKRLRQKSIGVSSERENLGDKIKFYEGLLNLVQNAKSQGELEVLYPKKSQAKKQKESLNEGIEAFFMSDYKILVGRNERANLNLLKNAKKDDIWLHIKDVASSHVIIKTAKTAPSEDVIKFAAKLCVEFSVKGAGKYEVDYTKRLNVRINEGANVNYVQYKTIVVSKD